MCNQKLTYKDNVYGKLMRTLQPLCFDYKFSFAPITINAVDYVPAYLQKFKNTTFFEERTTEFSGTVSF